METIYYIYHIPTVKIGVSTEPKIRVAKQGYSDYEILETHTDIMEVSRREQELQKQYGYKVDDSPYWNSRKNWGSVAGKLGGKHTSPNGGKISGKLPKYTMRKLTYEDAQLIREIYSPKEYSSRKLAKMYGVTRNVISAILNNKGYTQP